MARVLCTLAFASSEISGVAFERTDAGMLSAEIGDEAAAAFTAIRGYELMGETKPAEPAEPPAPASSPEGSGEAAAHQTSAKPQKRRAN
jgi:hypothetical protein